MRNDARTQDDVEAGFYPCPDTKLYRPVHTITDGQLNWAIQPNFGLIDGTPSSFASYHMGCCGKKTPAILLPHGQCHMHQDDGAALEHALAYAEALAQHGCPVACYMLHDGGITEEFMFGDKHYPAFRRMAEMMRHGGKRLSFNNDPAQVQEIRVAKHHQEVSDVRSLYLSAHFLSNLPIALLPAIGEVIDRLSRRVQPLIRFGSTVSKQQADAIIHRLHDNGITLQARYDQAAA